MTNLSDLTVKELRAKAKRSGVKQVTSSGDTKTKEQLIRSLRVAGTGASHHHKSHKKSHSKKKAHH